METNGKHAGGRPSKLTPELQEKIVGYIRLGNYRQVAARGAGVNGSRFSKWMRTGAETTSGQYFEFRKAVLEAEKFAEIAMVGLVARAAQQDAKHAEWWLERKFHSRWGRKDRHEITGKAGGPIRTQVVLSDDERSAGLANLLARMGYASPGPPSNGQSNGNGRALGTSGNGNGVGGDHP